MNNTDNCVIMAKRDEEGCNIITTRIQQLGIPWQLKGISWWDAVMLWRRYQNYCDLNALALLLKCNKEDVVNLKVLREKLGVTLLDETDNEQI